MSTATAMRPPFAYYGGKTGLARRLVDLLPPHRVYLEPFFGSGAVLFAKQPCVHEIVNDLDGNVVAFFRCLRDRPDELEAVCALTPYARDEFDAAREPGDIDDLERARRFWVRVNQSFAKTAGHNTGFSVTTARTQSTADSVYGRIGRFGECARRLMGVTIEHCDAAGLIDRLATPDSVVYVDPPYLGTTRRSGRGPRASDYGHDMPSTEQHEDLARALHETPATVLLSGYPSDLYDELYEDWHHVDFAVMAHSSNAVTSTSGSRVERVWSNRPLAESTQLLLAPLPEPEG